MTHRLTTFYCTFLIIHRPLQTVHRLLTTCHVLLTTFWSAPNITSSTHNFLWFAHNFSWPTHKLSSTAHNFSWVAHNFWSAHNFTSSTRNLSCSSHNLSSGAHNFLWSAPNCSFSPKLFSRPLTTFSTFRSLLTNVYGRLRIFHHPLATFILLKICSPLIDNLFPIHYASTIILPCFFSMYPAQSENTVDKLQIPSQQITKTEPDYKYSIASLIPRIALQINPKHSSRFAFIPRRSSIHKNKWNPLIKIHIPNKEM